MIRIDHLSFEFVAADESFAHNLYTDWDRFCRTCFENVVEECLSSYDKNKVPHEIGQLDLNLGNIPEEDFYREFPRRLREELLRVLPAFLVATGNMEGKTEISRQGNLLYYLEHGYLKAEWVDADFDLTEELAWAVAQSEHDTVQIAKLCLDKAYILRRLLWQTESEVTLLRLYTAALREPVSGLYDKRRFLGTLLETRPSIPVRFIHEAAEDEKLRGMADLLDSPAVRQIVTTETEEHAEVNLSPYWHYLYEWLIRYYPFNGLAIFGGKGDFTRHLHHRLLTFIRKRNHSYYLSKTELTMSFLLEVFGPVYYVEVLNAIYNLQPRNPDGSPVYDQYFNRELYHIFLRLSLLKRPAMTTGKEGLISEKTPDNSYPMDMATLTAFLKDSRKNKADKRLLLGILAKERPDIIIRWLQSEAAQETALVSLIAEITDMTIINRLLASVSFAVLDIAGQATAYLRSHVAEIGWLSGISESRLNLILHKATLLWIRSNGELSNLPRTECIGELLRLIYREITNRDDEAAIERVSAELCLPEKDWKQTIGSDKARLSIRKLKVAWADNSIPETIKRRMLALFLDQSMDEYISALTALHKQGLLGYVVSFMAEPVWEEIIRQSIIRIYGINKAVELLPLLRWLTTHESIISTYQSANTTELKVQLLALLANTARSQAYGKKITAESIHTLLTVLIGQTNIEPVITRISNESLFDFREWAQLLENEPDRVQTLLDNRWNTEKGFIDWLEDMSISPSSKQELLQQMVVEKPRKWIYLLRAQSQKGKMNPILAAHLPASLILQGMARVDFRQASTLSQTAEWLRDKTSEFAFLAGSNISLATALSEALLLYMQDKDTLGERTLTEKEIILKFLSCLYLVYTGKHDYREHMEWTGLSAQAVVSHTGRSDTEFSRHIRSMIDKQPERWLTWLEKEADPSTNKRIAAISDITLLERWCLFLPTVAGFEHPDVFRKLMTWLIRLATNRTLVADTIGVLLAWINETDWRRQTPQQMENYFLSRLFGKDNSLLPIERISDSVLPESIRKRWLRNHIYLQPRELLEHIYRSVAQNTRSVNEWLEWIPIEAWMRLAASLSLSQSELLRQVMECLAENNKMKESDLHAALAITLIQLPAGVFIYKSKEEMIRSFVQSLPSLQEKQELEKETIIQQTKGLLKIQEEESQQWQEARPDTPDFLIIGNAGLCLLAPWFPRLLDMVGYLDEEKRAFKDTASKIRAVFLLQYLTCSEEKEYRETELAFNRLLVTLPMHIPLPKVMELTVEEKQTADSMLAGVKANWTKMKGTSVKGFQQSFISRTGRLEQQDEKWLLTIDTQTYDILLESVPWAFRQIRLPWLKKYVQVIWYEKQEF